jgi:hypothetical protein
MRGSYTEGIEIQRIRVHDQCLLLNLGVLASLGL